MQAFMGRERPQKLQSYIPKHNTFSYGFIHFDKNHLGRNEEEQVSPPKGLIESVYISA